MDAKQLLQEILRNMSEQPLSKLLNKFMLLASEINETEMVRWAKLELNGYLFENPVLKEEDEIPAYRTVVGQYYDPWGKPIIIQDSKLHFVLEYRLRNPVIELEEYTKGSGELSISDPERNKLFEETFNIQVRYYTFSRSNILGILAGITTQLTDRIQIIKNKINSHHSREIQSLDVGALHPKIIQIAWKLFEDGHYRQAVLDAYIGLIEQVKAKSGRYDIDGAALMQNVFAPKNPKIVISNDFDEQMGYMWMFSGAVMGIRNSMAHKLNNNLDYNKALEWLSFASALFRVLDTANVTTIE